MVNAGMYQKLTAAVVLALLTGVTTQSVVAQKSNVPSSLLNFGVEATTATDGYMVAGELWSTIKPLNTVEANGVEDPNRNVGAQHFLTFGPNGGNWLNPGSHWPGGYDVVQTWRDGKRMVFPAFEADEWDANIIRASGEDPRFAFAYYKPTVAGANDPTRNYTRPARFTDATRTHLIYEAGWPTNIGVDFKVRAHQYTINEQNLNDFIAIEITMTNTGEVDADADGTVEISGHDIDAIASAMWVEPTIAVKITQTAGRSNRFGAGRTIGYAGATDPQTGAPYDIFYWFANVPEGRYANGATPAAGERRIGVNEGRFLEGYSDIWSGHRYLGAKQGSIVDGDLGAVGGTTGVDKLNLFGTHPVGTGAQKGWYSSVQWENPLFGFNNSDQAFRSATAAFYEDYGKTSIDFESANLAPNSNFFSGGTDDDVTTFVVGDASARPNGDIKYASIDLGNSAGGRGNDSPVWEDALLATPGDFYSTIGHTKIHTFGQDPSVGNGPYSLAVGESMTLVFAEFGGFRFEGLADAARAAEWAWNRDWDISADMPAPAAPDMKVTSTVAGTAFLQWTDVSAESPQGVDGYKIYRAAQFERSDWLDIGFRGIDNYQRMNTPGGDLTPFLDEVNPYFDAQAEFVGDIQGTYQPSEWGPYTLVENISAGDLSQYANATGGYDYAWTDENSITGFTYWYYVAAYKSGTYTGPQGSVNHLESSNWTRNGRNDPTAADGQLGLGAPWGGTYGYAIRNVDYPAAGTQEYKNIGAPFTVTPPVAPDEDVADIITVSPNPYIVTGLNDIRSNSTSHNINFLNLPSDYVLTIMDVSGQIVFQTEATSAVNGQFTWNMQSKDGIEVASGLYIYHLEYTFDRGQSFVSRQSGNRSVTGHFAILR